MELTGPSWLNLALQIPLALVIVFLTIRFLAFIGEQTKLFLDYLKEQRALDRQQLSESINHLSDSIHNKSMDELKELAALTQKVDGVVNKLMVTERSQQNRRNNA